MHLLVTSQHSPQFPFIARVMKALIWWLVSGHNKSMSVRLASRRYYIPRLSSPSLSILANSRHQDPAQLSLPI